MDTLGRSLDGTNLEVDDLLGEVSEIANQIRAMDPARADQIDVWIDGRHEELSEVDIDSVPTSVKEAEITRITGEVRQYVRSLGHELGCIPMELPDEH